MRASEFLTERKVGKPSKRQQQSTRGMQKFRDPNGFDRTYELNRIMMAVAMSDGKTPIDIDSESWSGRFNTAHPYTDVEADMLKMAFKAVGSELHDLNHGDNRSLELDNTNIQSITKPFKGYPK
jgi:hypothetical protein